MHWCEKTGYAKDPRDQNGLKLMTLQAIFNHFYLDFCPSDDADRQVSTCSIQWCKKRVLKILSLMPLLYWGPQLVQGIPTDADGFSI